MKDRKKKTPPSTRSKPESESEAGTPSSAHRNPPRTSTGKFTAPKFGSAGSGGAELEPGPEKD